MRDRWGAVSSTGERAETEAGSRTGRLARSATAPAAAHPAIYASGAHHITQNTLEVARIAPGHLVDGLARMLKRAGIGGREVAPFLLGILGMHFINEMMIEKFKDLWDTDPLERGRWSLIDDFGYCGGATMLIQYDRLVRNGTLKPGDLVAAYLE